MIIVRKLAAQGDVLFCRLEQAPTQAFAQVYEGTLVVAHSETGHHHAIETPGAQLFNSLHPLVRYLKFEGPFVDVVHQRAVHTHETLRLLGNDNGATTWYEVRRQREHAPEGWRIVED